MNIAAFPKYESHRELSLELTDIIPDHWEVWKISHAFEKVGSGTTPDTGRVAYYEGDISWLQTGDLTDGDVGITNKTISPLALREYPTLKVYPVGSLVMAMYGATIGKLGKLKIPTATNQACCVFVESHVVTSDFAFYSFLAMRPYILSDAYGGGQPNISQQTIKTLKIIVPPLSEQRAIAAFLDGKCATIDEAARIKEEQIKLLRERRQILIQQAVTRGLNPDAPMKDSGIDWIGKIPAHWGVRRGKYLFREVNERSESGNEELLSVSHTSGVTPRSEKNVNMFLAEDYTGSKLCRPGDIVINTMWAWMGALGVSDLRGIISPSYGVYRSLRAGAFNQRFLEWLLRTTPFIEQYNKISTGLHTSRLRLYPHMFLGMPMAFPNRDEQDSIVTHVENEAEKIDKAISIKQEQIAKLKEYKTSLINAAVTGKIKVI
ncbi:restriction endonuclease subunit S [Vreelandella venusta]|uniref:restriction endonuclease subunit S n=1 Tax=Vreelandella venusta TaxID=44935 RepID=UPI0040442F75